MLESNCIDLYLKYHLFNALMKSFFSDTLLLENKIKCTINFAKGQIRH